MLPAATSCSSGFQRCVRAQSTSVTRARCRARSLSPSRVASSSPPAPPPTITMRCSRLAHRVRRAAQRLSRLLEGASSSRRRLVECLSWYSSSSLESATMPPPAQKRTSPRDMHERADGDVEIHVAVEPDIADRPAVDAAALRLELFDDLHRAQLRRAGDGAARETACAADRSRRARARARRVTVLTR